MPEIRRALISVYDKRGIVPFSRSLKQMGVEILSTGGTARLLKKAGIPVRQVSEVTKFPEILDGRVKTLHPQIHGALLAVRKKHSHVRALKQHRIRPIDLLVVNLYPFWEAVNKNRSEEQILEMIDIGGPAMLRSAAKNFGSVAAVTDPADYSLILKELKGKAGQISGATLRYLASKVFKCTSSYDRMIHRYFDVRSQTKGSLPDAVSIDFEKVQDLRYGENPHQKGALYRLRASKPAGILKAKKLHGKELSFNNILDLDAAESMVGAFEETACAVIKHTSPCGFAVAGDTRTAFLNAYACDPVSAFGSIIGFNSRVDGRTAKAVLASGFVECIISRGFTKEALLLLKSKKNLRLLEIGRGKSSDSLEFKKVSGGLLLQDRDLRDPAPSALRCVTPEKPSASQIRDLLFAFKICRFAKSNAIVVAKGAATVGLGMGQPSRVDSCRIALSKAGKKARGAVLASDGFFPKPDSIRLAARAGVRAIIQPGGSIQDETVIRAAKKAGISMVFTGIRHFNH